MSIKDIAKLAGVSPSTVSRVLNDKPGCAGEELRKRIWLAARQTGYVPDAAARSLRKKEASEKPLKVSLVLARIRSLDEDPFFLELFRAVEVELNKARVGLYEVIMADGDAGAHAAGECVVSPDGIIILGRCSRAVLDRLKGATPNIVGLWRNPMNFEVDEVVCDGEKAAMVAVEHLISLGHKNIAYIGDCSYESRYVGYSETLIRNGLPINYRAIIHCEQTSGAGYEAMLSLIERSEVTALLCANDAIAIGAIRAMREKRARLSLISIDDIDQAQTTKPMLTTVRIPRSDMAHMAVTLLLDRIRLGHSGNVRVEFPCRVVVRESCFPV
ncbi:MAG: LacI family DNA-binding transcriptional regulator [Clostridia bacterium]|nr:LacI family DNA-binding transcriptional regulator [Clostridia bacterium]